MEQNNPKQQIEAIVSRFLEPNDRFVVTEEADAHDFVVTIYRGGRTGSFRVEGSEVAIDFALDAAGLERILETRVRSATKRLH